MIELFSKKKGRLTAPLPEGWEIAQTVFKEPREVAASTGELLSRALRNPIGSPPLEELAGPGRSVAVVVDDLTRPTPTQELLPVVLQRLHERGVAAGDITIIIGNGTHVPLSREEIALKVGPAVASGYRVVNHDAKAADLVVMGELPGYGSISFNPALAKADLKIIVGSILPHVHNGFGGGPKNIMPAVCDFETIRRHHLTHVLHHHSRVGIFEPNPFLRDLSAIAALAKVDFAVQCIYDSFGRIRDVLTGSVSAVHRAGAELETEGLGVRVTGQTEVTVVSSFPYDQGPQIMKAFMPAAMVTEPGGSIFVVAELEEPLPGFFLESARSVRGAGTAQDETRALEMLARRQPLIPDGAMDFNMAIILVFSVSRRFNLTLVGKPVLAQAAEAMGFGYQPDLDAALKAESALRPRARVSVIPGGGYIFPILDQPFHLFEKR